MRLTCNLPWIHVIHQLETHRKAPTKPVGMGNHKNHKSKLSDAQIRDIRARSHENLERLAIEFGISVSYLRHIISCDVRVKHIL